jgi:hypothetical protein
MKRTRIAHFGRLSGGDREMPKPIPGRSPTRLTSVARLWSRFARGNDFHFRWLNEEKQIHEG